VKKSSTKMAIFLAAKPQNVHALFKLPGEIA
jgi:hypothetical protein